VSFVSALLCTRPVCLAQLRSLWFAVFSGVAREQQCGVDPANGPEHHVTFEDELAYSSATWRVPVRLGRNATRQAVCVCERRSSLIFPVVCLVCRDSCDHHCGEWGDIVIEGDNQGDFVVVHLLIERFCSVDVCSELLFPCPQRLHSNRGTRIHPSSASGSSQAHTRVRPAASRRKHAVVLTIVVRLAPLGTRFVAANFRLGKAQQ
jgi:hypothetical protein